MVEIWKLYQLTTLAEILQPLKEGFHTVHRDAVFQCLLVGFRQGCDRNIKNRQGFGVIFLPQCQLSIANAQPQGQNQK